MEPPQRFIIVNIGEVQRRSGHGRIARQALRTDGQLEVTADIQTRLHFRHDGGAVIIDRVQGHAVRIEHLANVGTDLQHQLVQVIGVVNARGDLLQLPEKDGLERWTAHPGTALLGQGVGFSRQR